MHDSSLLGENLRKYRRLSGLTQSELAEKLFLTAQNISKWETGKSYPDLVNLCALARELGVSVDALLSSVSTDTLPLIAIDGGGTKTEFCLVERGGTVKERVVLGGTNPNAYGIDAAISTLFAGIDRLKLSAPKISAIYAGIAGCGLEANRERVLKELSSRYADTRCKVDSDIPNIIYSTDKYDDCIAVIMGTGSVVCASKDNGFYRIGGYGYLFDNGYCGYTLGREAVIAALRDEDKTAEATLLTGMLQKQLGGKVKDKLTSLYVGTNSLIAGFSKAVFEAYDMGDKVAVKIVSDAINLTLTEISAARQRYGTSNNIVVAGGLASRRDILEENIPDCEFNFIYPALPPVYGAAVCAALLDGKLCSDFQESFKKSYEELRKSEN